MTWIYTAWNALKAAGSWCAQHPAVTAILALLGALGIEGARLAHQKRKTVAAETRADTAVTEGKVAVIEERQAETRRDIKEAEAAETKAAAQVDEGLAGDAREVEVRRKIAERWKAK